MYCSKCYHERKYTRLELATWQDKIPLIVGIEEIVKMLTDNADGVTVKEEAITKEKTSEADWDDTKVYCLCEKRISCKIDKSNEQVSQSEPLDLSRSSSTSADEKVESCNSRKSFPSGSNYSERELISAVRAICCGRIGTRRAAALYGIPRSTLRNRIFKVYDAKRNHDENQTMSMVEFFKKIMKDDSMFSSVFQQKYQRENKEEKKKIFSTEREITKSAIRYKENHISNKELFKNELNEVMKNHQKIESIPVTDLQNRENCFDFRNADFLSHDSNLSSHIPELLNSYFRYDHQSQYASHFQSLMSNYLYMMCQQNFLASVYSSLLLPSWNFPSNFNYENFLSTKGNCDRKKDSMDADKSCKENDSVGESSGTSQKKEFDEKNGATSQSMNFISRPDDTVTTNRSNSIDTVCSKDDETTEESQNPSIQTSKSHDFNIASLSDETSESTRHKKRGHYRQYNTEMLNKAIEAVRVGEMSVHKAGNHFGVPHSTLEYRVKQMNDSQIIDKATAKRPSKRKQSLSQDPSKAPDIDLNKIESDGCFTNGFTNSQA